MMVAETGLVAMDSKGRVSLAKFLPQEDRNGTYRVQNCGHGRFLVERVEIVSRAQIAELDLDEAFSRVFAADAGLIAEGLNTSDEELAARTVRE